MGTIKTPFIFAAVALMLTTVNAYSQGLVDRDGDGSVNTAPGAPSGGGATSRVAGLLLIDRSHGEMCTCDVSLPYRISLQGWTVVEHFGGPITSAVLEPFDAFMVPAAYGYGYPNHSPGIVPFSASEQEAIASFYESGHGLWIFSEYLADPTGVNSVSAQFGVTFNDDIILDPDATPTPFWPVISNLVPHAITNGVASYVYYAGCSLNASSPAGILATADYNAYSDNYPAGTFPPVLAFVDNVAGGCAVFQGDISEVPDPMLANILDCLAFERPLAVEKVSWGYVKTLYR